MDPPNKTSCDDEIKNVYSKIMNLIYEQGTITTQEILIIQRKYPTFASLARSYFDQEYPYVRELMLAFQLKIHPVASFAVYNFIYGSKLGTPTKEWRQRWNKYSAENESDMAQLNEYIMIRNALSDLQSDEQDENVNEDDEKQ